ncbi:MAG TPA: winged helix-turn-helix domain-containing protein [Acidobacteriaceae bacterium]
MLVRLQSQPAQVLTVLVTRAGQVVSREELYEAVWEAETFVDFERGLNFCIAQIRSAMGDDSTTPVYIRTIPRRGYQFIAPVERLTELGQSNLVPAMRMSHTRKIAVVGALRLLLVVALGAFGADVTEQVEVTVDHGQMLWTRKGKVGRPIYHVGGQVFYPAGAPAVHIRFAEESKSMRMTVYDPELVLMALRK